MPPPMIAVSSFFRFRCKTRRGKGRHEVLFHHLQSISRLRPKPCVLHGKNRLPVIPRRTKPAFEVNVASAAGRASRAIALNRFGVHISGFFAGQNRRGTVRVDCRFSVASSWLVKIHNIAKPQIQRHPAPIQHRRWHPGKAAAAIAPAAALAQARARPVLRASADRRALTGISQN